LSPGELFVEHLLSRAEQYGGELQPVAPRAETRDRTGFLAILRQALRSLLAVMPR
jgi:hypothetical protein